jgi:acyl-CoA dehydrogenase
LNRVREVETMHGRPATEVRIENLRVPARNMLGGQAKAIGSVSTSSAPRVCTACWIAQAETALDMMVDRSLNRFAHGSPSRKAGHPVDDRRLDDGGLPGEADGAARRLSDRQRPRLRLEVSMAKHFVANALGRSSTARSRSTARSATRRTRRSRT